MPTPLTTDQRIANMLFSSVYPLYLAKLEKKGRTPAELDQVIEWLTGFSDQQIKKILFSLTLVLILSQSQAQKLINFSGQIKNSKTEESIYLDLGGTAIRLKLLEDGSFSTNASIRQIPSSFCFVTISTKGAVYQQTPLIWFEKDSIEVNIDWFDKSLQFKNRMPYQSLSEEIETLKGNKQNEFVLSNPVNVPILYFVNKNKEKISISDLEAFSQKVDEVYQGSIYFKSLTSYISAKKREPVKIGSIVEDFTLPNKDGNQVSVVNKDAKNKLITIFSSSCPWSIASISLLEKLAKINNGKIEIITIWSDDTRDSWLNSDIDQKNKITWTNIWDEYRFASTYLKNTGWPTFYVINAEGRLVDIFNNYSQKTANKLKDLIK
jgi:peroxiredoxin